MKNLKNITTVFSVMNDLNVSLNDLVAYRKNQTETENQSSQEQEPSSRTRLPLEVLYSDDTRSFFFEFDKTPVAIICGNIGFAMEDAPKKMDWHDADKYCENYLIGGKQWSLPNKKAGHLDTLYKNKEAINKVLIAFGKETLKESWYWASDSNYGGAWYMSLSDGTVYYYGKGNYYYVRPVILL